MKKKKEVAPIGRKLKALRTRKGLTQWQVAEMLHVSTSCYQFYEYGLHEPKKDLLVKLAEIFETPLELLVKDEVTLTETVRETSVYNRRDSDERDLLALARRMSYEQFRKFMSFGRKLVKDNKIE